MSVVIANSLEKTLMLGKIEGRRRKRTSEDEMWMASLTQWTRTQANFGRWWGTERPGMLPSMGLQKNWTLLGDWTTTLFYTSEQKLERPFLRLWRVSHGSRQCSGVRVLWWRGWEDDGAEEGLVTGRKPARWHLSASDLAPPQLSWNIWKVFIFFLSLIKVMHIFLLSK